MCIYNNKFFNNLSTCIWTFVCLCNFCRLRNPISELYLDCVILGEFPRLMRNFLIIKQIVSDDPLETASDRRSLIFSFQFFLRYFSVFFRSRKGFRLLMQSCLFFSRPFHEKFNFLKNCPREFQKFCPVFLHLKGPLFAQRRQNCMTEM